ncbi:MAG: ATP-binding protein, partial [Macromonas sp.]
REYLHTIDSSAKLLMVIINDILDFSKIEAGKLHVEHIAFDIRETVNDTLRAHRTQAETKGLRLHLDIAPDVPHGVGGDPVRLRQVLHNLVGNAIKFTAQGTVGVKLWQEAVPGQPHAQQLHLAVQDTGIGIPEHKQATIFDAFAQADTSTTRQYGGTGLGLSISKRLVELMEGQLWVESVPGLGSTFHVTLPCHAMALPAATTLSPALQVPVTAPTTTVAPVAPAVATAAVAGRVLLVEDNLVNQRLAQGLLKKMGHEVTLAANGAEAVEAYRHATFDLVLMDMQMPVLSGPEACEQIRQHEAAHGLRHTPIMAMTANAMSKDSELCLAAGMDDFMSKPLDVHRFTERVAYWIQQNNHQTR